MPLLKVASEDKQYEFTAGTSLMDIMLDAGLFIDNACGGKGICGKCRVKITAGEAGPVPAAGRCRASGRPPGRGSGRSQGP